MFTGIVQSVGIVAAATPKTTASGYDVEFRIEAPGLDLATTAVGDSIACSGCCLTVTKLEDAAFYVDVSRESLTVTTLCHWCVGTEVNLEKALRVGDALGGHYVSGHVDAVGEVIGVRNEGRSLRVEFSIPRALGRYLAPKGSICIDGVSLTVNGVRDGATTQFDVNLIPHTLQQTILRNYRVGTLVNVEIDMIARYLERLYSARLAGQG